MMFRMSSPEESRQLPASPPKLKCDALMFRFPARLWKIINACRSGAISWGPNGKTIRIIRSRFEELYLTSYDKPFKTGRFSSFIRQLNLYGFKKVAAPMILEGENIEYDDLYEYRHPYFRQGRSELLPNLQRNCKKPSPRNRSINSFSSQHKEAHKGIYIFGEIQPNTLWNTAEDEQQSGNIFRQENRVGDIIEDRTRTRWTTESGIENHPLLRPFKRATSSLQVNPEPSAQSSTISSGMDRQSPDILKGSLWQRNPEQSTGDNGKNVEIGALNKSDNTESTKSDDVHPTVNLNRCMIEREHENTVHHKKSAIQSLEEYVENVLDGECKSTNE